MTLIRTAALSAALFAATAAFAQRPAAPRGRPMTPEEVELINAQTRSAQAQADYYAAQTEKLKAEPTPPPTKELAQLARENPASVAVLVAATLTALVSLIVAAFTTGIAFLNYRIAAKARDDDKFHDALTMFGDKESPALRLSAAGILGDMALIKRREFDEKMPITTFLFRGRPYRETALNQLLGGLLLENNRVALLEIRRAIMKIMEGHEAPSFIGPDEVEVWLVRAAHNALASLLMARHAVIRFIVRRDKFPLVIFSNSNARLQRAVRNALASFFIANGAQRPDGIAEGLWEELPKRVYGPEIYRYLKSADEDAFAEDFKIALLKHKTVSYLELPHRRHDAFDGVLLAPYSLYLFVGIYSVALKTAPKLKSWKTVAPLFLVKADLRSANLKNAALEKAMLSGAKLANARLCGANLQGAWLPDADLKGAKLCGAKINDQTVLDGVKWWEADFYKPGWRRLLPADRRQVDAELLRTLCPDGAAAPAAPDEEIHPSVKQFLQARGGGNGAQAAA